MSSQSSLVVQQLGTGERSQPAPGTGQESAVQGSSSAQSPSSAQQPEMLEVAHRLMGLVAGDFLFELVDQPLE